MPLLETRGAASVQGFGALDSAAINYIEEVFSTYLYTGTGANQTFNNGVDLSTKGGMVWIKQRSSPAEDWRCVDSARGITNGLQQNLTNAQQDWTGLGYVTSFNTNGFSIGTNVSINTNAYAYASWTFRKQPKFFDVVTYTGNGSNRTIAHNLGSAPGCVIIKCTSQAYVWVVYHRGMTSAAFAMQLQAIDAQSSEPTYFNSTAPTSTVFSVGTANVTNQSGQTYVAYLFAHNAGGFGLTGTDNVISCGSFTGEATVNLGYEPQWVLTKKTSDIGDWVLQDTMRGIPTDGGAKSALYPNLSAAESTVAANVTLNSTGFSFAGDTGTRIYIAIRRGPMKTPTSGTSVFGLNARSGTGANATVTGGQVDDAVLVKNRGSAVASLFSSRLTGTGYLVTSSTAAEVAAGTTILQANPWDVMDGVKVGTTSTITNASSNTFINYLFQRAPGFFDVVCYTGTGSARTINHNLGVVPELMIVKKRSGVDAWFVYSATLGNDANLALSNNSAVNNGTTLWNTTTPTASVFSVGTSPASNESGFTFVMYLFASVAGVSKVGSYTGNGTSQTINCGFTGGSRFVLIKRTDSTGNWTVFDSARGIVAGNDPALYLNSTAAEVTTIDAVDTDNSGFIVNQDATLNLNVNAATYIFLAIA